MRVHETIIGNIVLDINSHFISNAYDFISYIIIKTYLYLQ